jgi:hypothetical protein
VFGGATTWNPPTGYDHVNTMRYVAAFDVDTGQDLPAYLPWISTRAVRGPWSLVRDTVKKCMWVGGDLTQTKRTTDHAWQSSAGFAASATPTRRPRRSQVRSRAPGRRPARCRCHGKAATDSGVGGIKYTVFRDNYAIATVAGTSYRATPPRPFPGRAATRSGRSTRRGT